MRCWKCIRSIEVKCMINKRDENEEHFFRVHRYMYMYESSLFLVIFGKP